MGLSYRRSVRSYQVTESHLGANSEDVVRGERKKIAYVRKFCNSHYSPNIIWVIKFRFVGWVEHAARAKVWTFPSKYHKAEYHLEDLRLPQTGEKCSQLWRRRQFRPSFAQVSPKFRPSFAQVSPKFRVDCGKEIRVVIHTNASVLW